MSEIRLDCPSSVNLTEAETVWLDSVPNAAHDVPGHIWCELGAEHAGRHVGLAQAEDTGGDRAQVNYWAWWDNSGAHEISTADGCDAASYDEDPEGQFCLLPSGHVGRHSF
jgi:hypothetical protein